MKNKQGDASGSAMDEESALDAIGAIAEVRIQRIRRAKQIKRIKWACGALAVLLLAWFFVWVYEPVLDTPVAVLLPNPDRDGVKDNAIRQWAGFQAAFAQFNNGSTYDWTDIDPEFKRTSHYCFFDYPLKSLEESPEEDRDNATLNSTATTEPPVTGADSATSDSLATTEPVQPVADDMERKKVVRRERSPTFKDIAYDESKLKLAGSGSMDQEVCADNLRDQFEWWYSEKAKRVFVITMSGAVLRIKDEFDAWATSKGNDRPVLVATVASAPGIADREAGRFRYYVRSEDETDVFGNYVDSKGFDSARVFYVDDAYGQQASELLKTRLELKAAHLYPLPVANNKDATSAMIQQWLRKFRDEREYEDIEEDKREVVFEGQTPGVVDVDYADEYADEYDDEDQSEELRLPVILVAYGENIKFALEALRCSKKGFAGDILIASTYTECDWRLDTNFDPVSKKCELLPFSDCSDDEDVDREITHTGKSFRNRIYTVGSSKPGNLDRANYGVVYQFANLALQRAMRCAEESYGRPRKPFWNCWSKPDVGKDYEVEITANGDSRVSLKLLTHRELDTISTYFDP